MDALLTPIGLMEALAAHDAPAAALLTLPLAGLFTLFACERQTRIDHMLELGPAYRAPRCSSATSWRPMTSTPAFTRHRGDDERRGGGLRTRGARRVGLETSTSAKSHLAMTLQRG